MPVRNGERFIADAIDSLLAQTFTDFELIIVDNASVDRTEQICTKYAALDPRIRYHRNPSNLGPAQNHNRCFALSRGQYFRWHAHDDMCLPTYLTRCVSALDNAPSAVLAFPKTLIIDADGEPLENYEFELHTNAAEPARRFAELVLVNHRRHRAVEIFGLMRSEALRETPLEGAYARGDSVLLARLALLGRFIEVPQTLFLSRSHATQSMQTLPVSVKEGQSRFSRLLGTGPLPPPEWWDPTRKGRINFPEWNLLKEYWLSIGRASLDFADRACCYGVMTWWLVRNAPKLARDVIFAGETLFDRVCDAVRGVPRLRRAHAGRSE